MPKKELIDIDDIKSLVDTFYQKVRSDALLSPVFNERIGDQWDFHLEKMYRFWQTVLLGEHTYLGSPFPPHATLPITHAHFQQWLNLFKATVDELFTGEKAEETKVRADKIAEMFEARLAYFKQEGSKNIL